MKSWALLLLAMLAAAQVRPVRMDELPPSLHRPGWLAEIHQATTQRVRDGEWDHLIFYALQSTRFTTLPPIEPSHSAKTWQQAGRIPDDAARRLQAFFSSQPSGERHVRMRAMVTTTAELHLEYERAMKFLYEKEWASPSAQGAARREHVATLYQTRAHSTDTDWRATYGVHIGLSVLKQTRPSARIRRVLLIGPGLDWAPRTALHEDSPPQSNQPYALADSLIRLGLAAPGQLTIDCADVNPRVVDHVRAFPDSPRRLLVRYAPGDADWNSYFDQLGRAAGQRDGRFFAVSKPIASQVHSFQMNILTQRVSAAGSYDLAVATNVLLYFNDRELGLALANIRHALAASGFFLHNDLRQAVDEWGREFGLPIVHARTVRIDANRELHDGVVLHAVLP